LGAANIRIIFYLSTKILFFSTLSVDNFVPTVIFLENPEIHTGQTHADHTACSYECAKEKKRTPERYPSYLLQSEKPLFGRD
jgi:hypothetical protein